MAISGKFLKITAVGVGPNITFQKGNISSLIDALTGNGLVDALTGNSLEIAK